MAWKQYILQKKQISTDAGATWSDAEPYETRLGRLAGTFDTYDECMNIIYRWTPTSIEYCSYNIDETTKAAFGYTGALIYPEDAELSNLYDYYLGLDKDGTSGDSIITANEISAFKKDGLLLLSDAMLLNGISIIEEMAFVGCSAIKSVEIPNSIMEIRDGAFSGCTSLEKITIEASTPPTIGNGVFNNTNQCPIYVPEESVADYKTAWSSYSYRIHPII